MHEDLKKSFLNLSYFLFDVFQSQVILQFFSCFLSNQKLLVNVYIVLSLLVILCLISLVTFLFIILIQNIIGILYYLFWVLVYH